MGKHRGSEDQRSNALGGPTGPRLVGRLHSLGFCSWVSSRKSETTRRRGRIRVASDVSGSDRVDMFTRPVAAARAADATGVSG